MMNVCFVFSWAIFVLFCLIWALNIQIHTVKPLQLNKQHKTEKACKQPVDYLFLYSVCYSSIPLLCTESMGNWIRQISAFHFLQLIKTLYKHIKMLFPFIYNDLVHWKSFKLISVNCCIKFPILSLHSSDTDK